MPSLAASIPQRSQIIKWPLRRRKKKSGFRFACDGTGNATAAYALRPGAQRKLVGNGKPLGVSNKQVIFRDLDGLCSFSF